LTSLALRCLRRNLVRSRQNVRHLAAFSLAAAILQGCVTTPPAPPPPPPAAVSSLPAQYRAVSWNERPGWREDKVGDAWPAFRVGCKALRASATRQNTWQGVCAAGDTVDGQSDAGVRAFFESHFIAYEVSGSDGSNTGRVTGYYEPLLSGSRQKDARFAVPLYGVPDDLLIVDLADLYPELKGKRVRGRIEGRRVLPYWSRGEIEQGHGRAGERILVYVNDLVDAFFLQIQGSGRVALDDGSVIRVGYADQNGHPYRSVGTVLMERGEMPLERTSLAGIREWGRRNPDKLPELLDQNPSYVFFREVSAPVPGTLEAQIDGPIGSLGVPLLRERTVAVDQRAIPLGAPVYLATTYPSSTEPLQRLMLAQDTGGAIRGAVRADFFWGFGDEAGRKAGTMRQEGRMWLLWPRNVPLPNTGP
jgi:membrane-bound lytic murein transglycosylase A